jgi:hypothetical protein
LSFLWHIHLIIALLDPQRWSILPRELKVKFMAFNSPIIHAPLTSLSSHSQLSNASTMPKKMCADHQMSPALWQLFTSVQPRRPFT